MEAGSSEGNREAQTEDQRAEGKDPENAETEEPE